jgi:hypothetical protein
MEVVVILSMEVSRYMGYLFFVVGWTNYRCSNHNYSLVHCIRFLELSCGGHRVHPVSSSHEPSPGLEWVV